ncbi:MAG: MgtC/SapB family protein [Planctomycetes bacterium]|nr:MgtC/SapB family protein [Planctomycetota bacterium]
MEPVAEDLYRFGVALAIGALIGLERQFSGTHDDEEEPAGPALLAPPSEGELRAAVAAGRRRRWRAARAARRPRRPACAPTGSSPSPAGRPPTSGPRSPGSSRRRSWSSAPWCSRAT